MTGFYLIVSAAGIIAFFTTFVLYRYFRQRPLIKFIPCILLALLGIWFILKARYFSAGFEGLGYIVYAIIDIIMFFISLITAWILELYRRKTRKT
jgi:hypothetical protein